ncbi:MAG: ASKHA domain-containing protein [bacterium]
MTVPGEAAPTPASPTSATSAAASAASAASEHIVTFQPSGRRGPAIHGQVLLDVARKLGVEIESNCGGKGTCRKCRVRIESAADSVSAATEVELQALGAEAIAAGTRLACQTQVEGNARVFVPEESRRTQQVVRKEAGARTVPLDPAIKCYHIVLVAPTLEDPVADAERLLAALEQQHGLTGLEFDLEVLRTLPGVVRRAEWDLTVIVWRGESVADVRPAGDARRVLGLALDVGTTTIAAYLTNLADGEILATESAMNPQVAFGDDVISRLYHVAHHPEGLGRLQEVVIAEVNSLAKKAVERSGAALTDIFDVVMVGNTAMHHLFLGLDTRALGLAPFAPAVQGAIDARASSVGLTFHPGCRLHTLPVEAGFVGADNVGVLIAEAPYDQDEILLIIDIGTNGELVLGNRRRMLSTSCATGPALEGSHIEFGMRAAPGAIERIRIEAGTLDVRFKVIGLEGWHTSYPPGEVGARGICGSGIIEAAAEMLKAGVILPNGNLDPQLSHERVILEDGKPRKFVIAWPEETAIDRSITVSLKDIRAIQLAKAALRAGAEILLRTYGVEKPDRVILAGAFGTYIDRHHALAIGMLPDCEPEAVTSVGNAAGDGARFALLSLSKRREAAWVADKVEFVELATDPDFQREYVKAMSFDPISAIPED